ncbi:hypothetical protein OC845_004608 [Tilletia horrida]|nr:hypothetical protein OC845_004608 [Tilletia horrida]
MSVLFLTPTSSPSYHSAQHYPSFHHHHRQGLFFDHEGAAEYDELSAKAAFFQAQAQAALARREARNRIPRIRAFEAAEHKARHQHHHHQRELELERLRAERAVLIEHEMARRHRIGAAVAAAKARAQAELLARASAHAEREAAGRARHRACRKQQSLAQQEQADLGNLFENLLTAALGDFFGEDCGQTACKTQEARDKGKAKAQEEPEPTREELSVKAVEHAQQALFGNADMDAFTQAFGDLFQHVFGIETEASHDEKESEHNDATATPVIPSTSNLEERSSPITPTNEPGRSSGPALSTSSRARKAAHVRDADENGEEVLLPEDEDMVVV